MKIARHNSNSGSRRLSHSAAAIILAASSFFSPAAAHAESLNADVAKRVEGMMGNTVFFRNDTDKIPQVEYFRPDGTGFVWSAALGDKVVPVLWTADNGKDGEGRFCMLFKAADIGTARDMRLCDDMDIIASGARDERKGDVYGLSRSKRMAAALPSDASGFRELDRLLGRK